MLDQHRKPKAEEVGPLPLSHGEIFFSFVVGIGAAPTWTYLRWRAIANFFREHSGLISLPGLVGSGAPSLLVLLHYLGTGISETPSFTPEIDLGRINSERSRSLNNFHSVKTFQIKQILDEPILDSDRNLHLCSLSFPDLHCAGEKKRDSGGGEGVAASGLECQENA